MIKSFVAFALRVLLLACQGESARHAANQPAPMDKSSQSAEVALVYYDYGGPPEPRFHKAQIEVLRRYSTGYAGFGCVITDSLAKAIPAHNDSVFAALQARYPGLSQDEMLAEIQDYVNTQKAIEGTIAPCLKTKIRHGDKNEFYCDGGNIRVGRKAWDKHTLKATFSFTFQNPEHPARPIYWRGKIYSPIEQNRE